MSRLYRINDRDSLTASLKDGGDGAIRRYLPKQRPEYLNYNQDRFHMKGGSLVEQARRVGKKIKGKVDEAKESKVVSKIARQVHHLTGDKRAKKIEELARQHGFGQEGGSLKSIIKKVGSAISKLRDTKAISKVGKLASRLTGNETIAQITRMAEQAGFGQKGGSFNAFQELQIPGSRFADNFPMRPRALDYVQSGDPLDFQGDMSATLDLIEMRREQQI